jgi:hypothetical protein
MTATPDRPARSAGAAPLAHPFLRWEMGADPVQRHLVGLEPKQAWRLKGLCGADDEIVIPGILLDDFGRSASIEAGMAFAVFCQMQAMAALAELRMLEGRGAARPHRTKPEANVWLLDGRREGRRIEVVAVASLDRIVFLPDRHLRVDTMAAAQIVPGEKAWR